MTLTESPASSEKTILIGLILSTEFIERIRNKLDHKKLRNKYAKKIAQWCFDYYDVYQQAPGRQIKQILSDKGERLKDVVRENIENLLLSVTDDFDDEDINVAYLVDETDKYLTYLELDKFIENLQDKKDEGEYAEAQSAIFNYAPPDFNENFGTNIITCPNVLARAFDKRRLEPLFHVGGDLGKMVDEFLVRESFISIQAGEKVGKSFLKIDWTKRALRQGRRVAFFSVGDMTEEQMALRFAVSISGCHYNPKYCLGKNRKAVKGFIVADQCEIDDESVPTIGKSLICYKQHGDCDVLTLDAARAINHSWFQRHFIPNENFRHWFYPNKTCKLSDIDGVLTNVYRRYNWVPDVIFIDYADILAPEKELYNTREEINATWKAMRRLSQTRHCLLVTSTQANRDSYSGELQSKKMASEDKRKHADVTACLGLNSTDEDKSNQVLRANLLFGRDGEGNASNFVVVGQCLPRGRFHTASKFFSKNDSEGVEKPSKRAK